MNSNNPFGGPQNTGNASQSAALFGQTSVFGQSAGGLSGPSFGQSSSMFGQLGTTSQAAPVFGQSTPSQNPAFGQTTVAQPIPSFGQTNSGFSSPMFGQASTGQSAPAFGQSGPVFGQTTSEQPGPIFGQANSGQSGSMFAQDSSGQSGSAFSQATSGQSGSLFGQATSGQPVSAFGQVTSGQSGSVFGQVASGQSTAIFGQDNSGHAAPTFGQTAPAFGQGNTGPSASPFGQTSTTQPSSAFVQPGPTFGHSNSNQTPLFGQGASSQSASPFAQVTTSQSNPLFAQQGNNQSTLFSQSNINQAASPFAQTVSSQSSTPFGSSGPVFGQAASGSSVYEQLSKQSQGESSQGSVFGQSVSGTTFAFSQPASAQNPLFGQNTSGQSLGQSSSTQLRPDGSNQNVAFGQTTTDQNNLFNQTPKFGQPPSAQSSKFGTVSTTQTGRNNTFGETGEKISIFGPPPSTATSEQTKSIGLAFGGATQMTTNSNVPESKVSTSMASSPFAQMSSIASSNTAFKPIFAGAGQTQEASEKPLFGKLSAAASSGERQKSSLFSFSTENKLKDESGPFRPPFASADSSFTSFNEEVERQETHKALKQKEDPGHSTGKHEYAPSDNTPPDLHREDPSGRRSTRMNREIKASANILYKSLFDALKSQMKSQQKESKKKDTDSKLPDPDTASSQTAARNHPTSESRQHGLAKPQVQAVPIQPPPYKPPPPAGPGTPSRTVTVVGPNFQSPGRDSSVAGPSQLLPGRIRPLMELVMPQTPPSPTKTPLRRTKRSDSTDSIGPLSPNEQTCIQLKNLPPHLNKKQALEAFFKKFGKIQRTYCKPGNTTAIIHFAQHKAAANAKKAVKKFHANVSVFWYRKKSSPGKTPLPKIENREEERKEMQSEQESNVLASPVRKPIFRTIKGSPQKKSQFAKTLQFDVDNTDAPTTSSDSAIPSLPPSLLLLVGTVAETPEEKYRLLDQRDRILRQVRVKRTELDQANVFVGTCQDMCPEKERYMRETRNQLSIFEILPGSDKIDHATAIKEYSRSSADQEEPLPHELRPLPVLCMTMDYLVTYIMDNGENNYRDWYDFVWNRTRGIRKDITQQHLCDPVTVSLMEKCMRFHIHCAYELCEEPMSAFEPKINNENLTKCLQSLKEMYQDLHNRGETCPCEPEFRGYSVLLNLNKGDILREVQQFQESVRNSAEVKFALQVFSAFNSTNYVRFFKLVRSSSYLNSCILHGYFGQIRRRALQVMNIAYTFSPQRPTLFPLEEVVRLLLFQDADQATGFLTAYGLSVSDGFVEINRSAFAEPEAPLLPKKSPLISHKCNVSVGQVVNGATLPTIPLHTPVCSFDAQNRYTGFTNSTEIVVKSGPEPTVIIDKPEVKDSVPEDRPIKRTIVLLKDDQESSSIPCQSVFQPIVPPEVPPSPPKPAFTDVDVAAVLLDIVEETVKEFSVEIGQTGAAYISAALGESSLVADRLLAEVILDLSSTITKEEMKAQTERVLEEKRRKAEEARRIHEREQLLSEISQYECDSLLKIVLQENIKKISSEELQKAIQKDHNERISRCSLHISQQFVDQFVKEELDQIANETLYEMQLCRKYFQRWREVLGARKKLRRQMRGFPAAPGLMGYSGTLKALIPSAMQNFQTQPKGIVNLGNAGKLFVSFISPQQRTEQILHTMKVQHFFQELLCDAAWTPLELPSLIANSLPSWKNCIFWKVVLALPETSQPDDLNSVLSKWLQAKFCWAGIQPADAQKQQLQTLALYNSLVSQEGFPVSLNVCVKAVHGPLADSELDKAESQNELWGTNSLVFLLPFTYEKTEEYWISAILQLKQLLNCKPFWPAPSLAVLVPGSSNEEKNIEEELGLQDLVSCELISDYIVLSIPETVTNMKGTEVVTSAVQFLLSHCPRSPQLHALPFRQYIEDGVYHAFSDPFYYDMSNRRKFGLPSQDPAAIIDLYNGAIAYLAKVVSSSRLVELSWPLTEFTSSRGSFVMPPMDWNSLEHLSWLKKAVLSFQIPEMDKPPEGAPWQPVCSMIKGYVSQISKSSEALPVLNSEVQMLLGGVWDHCLENGESEGSDSELFVHEIPWDDLIALCINHKLRDWNPPFNEHVKGSLEDLYVYFFEKDLENFKLPESWLKACHTTDKDLLMPSDSSSCRRKRKLQPSQTAQSFLTREENTQKDVKNLMSLHSHLSQFLLEEENESSSSKKRSVLVPSQPLESSFVAHMENAQTDLDRLKSLQSQLNQALLAEKQESEKFNEKLQHLLEEEPLDVSLSLPLYLPNTSLQGALENATVVRSQHKPSTDGTLHSNSQSASLMSDVHSHSSLRDLMNSLHTSIRRYKDEDIAFDLHMSNLLDVAEMSSSPNETNM
ncbi:germinal-center associated nuclear protein [Rana temporaria]|uniref:germinal-center associated nuclear protein n=1 Tax=Rana temporaria TaxID=8407 RepID=UPI001AADBB62|nr:germinal-center associated nuclear protein [Rana temporaria]